MRWNLVRSAFGLIVAVTVGAACGALQVSPRYGSCGSGPDDGFGCSSGGSSYSYEVAYVARCAEMCEIRFLTPGASFAGEQFEGDIRRTVRFDGRSPRGITMTVTPVDATDTVTRAHIQVDGKIVTWMQDRERQRGKEVTLSTTLQIKGDG